MRTILISIFLLILACNSSQKTNLAKDPNKSMALDSPNKCSCKDSFYAAILDKATIENSLKNKHRRLRFDFYENKKDGLDSFKIEGWYQKGSLSDTSILINLSPHDTAAQSFNTPYHFRDLQLAVKNNFLGSFPENIQKLLSDARVDTAKCNFEIVLTPYQDPLSNIITIDAQLFYDCSIGHAIPNWISGESVKLNPCPPKKPQG